MGGWVRWPPGGPVLETKRKLGIFTLLVTRRDVAKRRDGSSTIIWQVDFCRSEATTVVYGRDVTEAEQLALIWAFPIIQAAWKQTEAAFRAQNRTP